VAGEGAKVVVIRTHWFYRAERKASKILREIEKTGL